MTILAFYYFGQYRSESNNNNGPTTAPTQEPTEAPDVQMDSKAWGILMLLLVAAGLLSAAFLQIMKGHAANMIWCTLFSTVALMVVNLIGFVVLKSVPGIIVMVILILFNLLYIYMVRSRIPFAAAMLETVVECIQLFPATVWVAIGSIFIQAIGLLIWVVGAASILHAMDNANTPDNTRSLVYFLLTISVYWTTQVIKNVVHVTVSGTFATWYFMYPNNMPANPTLGALKRATWTSFGSICLGSLLVAIIKALRSAAERAGGGSRQSIGQAILICLVSMFERLVEYFNVYAFTQVAIYGKPYCEAASDTWKLIKARGLDIIINDNLIGSVLVFGALAVGLANGAFGLALSYFVFNYKNSYVFFGFIGLLVGFLMALCAMEVVDSCVASCFVCYAEDPEALQRTKPTTYDRLTNALHHRTAELQANQPVSAGRGQV